MSKIACRSFIFPYSTPSRASLQPIASKPAFIPLPRSYASTSGSASSRRQVTIANDDGRVQWGELSRREKAARTTQQSVNFLVIIAGMAATGAVGYVLYREVFAPESVTNHFSRAITRIKSSPACTSLLGPSNQLEFHGEPSWSRWARNRTIASKHEVDKTGLEHLNIRFYVTGPLNKGTVRIHLVKRKEEKEYRYRYLALEVPEHQTVYLEKEEGPVARKEGGKMFGVRWW
ncbi:TIM21-domain-containing protein [Patellaria atrata CBS 101060]|uniref:Mitochondrial import inner membrane translocase subunit Tim21 n=1 Tax=Patellaria atrata CBS 101060 TaxID=1346257 RepID=A0A9P4VPA1_9PEZI|nr:TIM21-domain-containing protein [Patellaria atrata CBS 101060]